MSCDRHRMVEMDARARFLGTPTAVAPQHLLCAPDGSVLLRREYWLSRDDLASMMREAIRRVAAGAWGAGAGAATGADPIAAFRKSRDSAARRGIVLDLMKWGRTDLVEDLLAKCARRGDRGGLPDALEGIVLSQDPDAAGLILPLLSRAPSERTRGLAAHALERLGDPGAVKALLGRLDRERSLRLEAVVALKYVGDRPEVRERLLALLRSSRNRRMRLAAAWTLGSLREKGALPLLRAMLDAPSRGSERVLLESALARIEGAEAAGLDYEALVCCFSDLTD